MTEPNAHDPVQPPLEEPPADLAPEPGDGLVDVDAGQPSGADQPPVDVPRTDLDDEVLGAPPSPGGAGDPTQRDPHEWVTGDDPATEAQKAYLDRLARQAGEEIPAAGLTKAQASEHIDRLQAKTGMEPRQS